MKIYSWNVLFRNKRFDDAYRFIAESDFDICCLQEVPESFLARLRTLPLQIAYAPEVELVHGKTTTPIYNVILSRYPLVEQQDFSLAVEEGRLSLRSRIFRRILIVLGIWVDVHLQSRSGLLAKLDTPDHGRISVISAHLSSATSALRARELPLLFQFVEQTHPALVCGDLNIVESFYASWINWFMGGPLLDAVLPKRERARVEGLFRTYKYRNPLRGRITHLSTFSQLDHILVSDAYPITAAGVLRGPGSDHRPIYVEI